MTNYEVPQNALLRNRFFYEFLLTNDRQIADEIRREYIDTLSKVYFSYFKAYSAKLMKLQVSRKNLFFKIL
jgi:UDP-N-acetylglucosamine 2-epimerase